MRSDAKYKACIVGLGPSGLGAALTLSKSGLASELVCLDQGSSPNKRACSILLHGMCEQETPCQMISGFGGCSLLGGGKVGAFPAGSGLSTILGNHRVTDQKLSEAINVLSALVPLEKPDIEGKRISKEKLLFERMGFTYKHFDVYQFDHEELRKAYEIILSQMQSAGVSVLLNAKVIEIGRDEHGFNLKVQQNGQELMIVSEYLILALGRSGQSMLERVNVQLDLGGENGQLDIGVRLEFPTHLASSVSWNHRDLKLLFKSARTFCVCRNGSIAPYLIDGVFFTEGYCSQKKDSGFTNLGIIIRFEPSDRNRILLDDIQERSIRHRCGKLVCQILTEYLDHSATVARTNMSQQNPDSFWVWGDVNDVFPASISAEVKEAVMYFAQRLLPRQRWGKVKVFAPEVDYRGILFPVKPNFSIRPRLFIIGDCVGQFRGIAQALCSGIVCAESLVRGRL